MFFKNRSTVLMNLTVCTVVSFQVLECFPERVRVLTVTAHSGGANTCRGAVKQRISDALVSQSRSIFHRTPGRDLLFSSSLYLRHYLDSSAIDFRAHSRDSSVSDLHFVDTRRRGISLPSAGMNVDRLTNAVY